MKKTELVSAIIYAIIFFTLGIAICFGIIFQKTETITVIFLAIVALLFELIAVLIINDCIIMSKEIKKNRQIQ